MTASRRENARGTKTFAPIGESGAPGRRYAVCIRNEGHEVSLDCHKIYVVLPDDDAERHGDVRAIDETGEDFLFFSRSIRRHRRSSPR